LGVKLTLKPFGILTSISYVCIVRVGGIPQLTLKTNKKW